MTDAPFTYADHRAAFEKLLSFMRSGVVAYRQLLLDFVSLNADLSRASIPQSRSIAGYWLEAGKSTRLQSENPRKFEEQYEKLYALLK